MLDNKMKYELFLSLFSRPLLKAGRELQTELDRMMEDEGGRTLSGAGAGHRAVFLCWLPFDKIKMRV